MTFNRSARAVFDALSAMGRSSVPEIVASQRTDIRSPVTVMRALNDLVRGGLAIRIPAKHGHDHGHWQLVAGAIMPAEKLAAPRRDIEPLGEREIWHQMGQVPPELTEQLTLRGMVARQMGQS